VGLLRATQAEVGDEHILTTWSGSDGSKILSKTFEAKFHKLFG
jgi:hypothetical protein